MKIRILLAYLVAALVQGCALMPPPADQPAGVGGRTIELPSPPGLVSTPVDHPGTAVRNAQLKAESKRPLRHFLRHDDYARTRSGLAPRHSQEGYAAVIADLQTTTFGRDVIDELKAQIEADIAAGPDQERDPPDPEQVAALHQTVDPNLTIERISIEPTALTLTDHGPDHVCSLMVTRQETTVSAIPYYTFFEYYSSQSFSWYQCWALVRGRLIEFMLADEGASDRLHEDLAQRMKRWLNAVWEANARPEPGVQAPVQSLS